LRNGGRIGIQAPATTEYSPHFIEAIRNVEQDPRTKDIFSYFIPPWFFCETGDEYSDLFRNAGFDVPFSEIATMRTRYPPRKYSISFPQGQLQVT
ncbi:MAG: hypothetical protein M8353_10550, partial [ANME-2 cluster archaeon]|nr:hypothetical protein [ANME-2 cluster archaeon]